MFLDLVKSCQFKDVFKKENDFKTYFSTLWEYKRCKNKHYIRSHRVLKIPTKVMVSLWKKLPEGLLIKSILNFKSKMFIEDMQFRAFNIFFFIFLHAPRPDNLKVWQMQYWWCSVGIWKKIRGISRCQPDTERAPL